MSNIVTVIAGGAEYVGRLKSIDESGLVLTNPRMITFTEQGMGFANGIAATGKQDPDEMTILQPTFMTETNEDVVKAWHQATSGLMIP